MNDDRVGVNIGTTWKKGGPLLVAIIAFAMVLAGGIVVLQDEVQADIQYKEMASQEFLALDDDKDGSILLTDNILLKEMVVITSDLVIDFNGYEIKGSSNSKRVFEIQNADVVFSNGIVKWTGSNWAAAIDAYYSGDVTLDGMTLEMTGECYATGVSGIQTNGTGTTIDEETIDKIRNSKVDKDTECAITFSIVDTKITADGPAFGTHGDYGSERVIIDGSELTSKKDVCVYLPSNAVTTIADSTLVGVSGIDQRTGYLEMSNVKVVYGNPAGVDKVEVDGPVAFGIGVAFVERNYGSADATMVCNSVKYEYKGNGTANANLAIIAYQMSSDKDAIFADVTLNRNLTVTSDDVSFDVAKGVASGATYMLDNEVSIGKNTAVNGAISFDENSAVFSDMKAGESGITLTKGSIKITGDYVKDTSDGSIIVTGDAFIEGTVEEGVTITVASGANLTVSNTLTFETGSSFVREEGSKTSVPSGNTVTFANASQNQGSGLMVVEKMSDVVITADVENAPTAEDFMIIYDKENVFDKNVKSMNVTIRTPKNVLIKNSEVLEGADSGTDVGNYYVTLRLFVSYNIDGTDTDTYVLLNNVLWTISPADPTVTVTMDGWTFGETANAPNFNYAMPYDEGSYPEPDNITYTYVDSDGNTYDSADLLGAGEYTIIAHFPAQGNYAYAEAEGSFTVDKASIGGIEFGVGSDDVTESIRGEYTYEMTEAGVSVSGEISWFNDINSVCPEANYPEEMKSGFFLVTKIVNNNDFKITYQFGERATHTLDAKASEDHILRMTSIEDWNILISPVDNENYKDTVFAMDLAELYRSTVAGYEEDASEALDAISGLGFERTDVGPKTMFVTYDGRGYEGDLTAELSYKGKTIYSETVAASGIWYFSFDAGSPAYGTGAGVIDPLEVGDYQAGEYELRIVDADGTEYALAKAAIAGSTCIESGYETDGEAVKDIVKDLGGDAHDAINRTMYVVYNQFGMTDKTMTGELYYEDGTSFVFTQDLLSKDGVRTWYFSFDDELSKEGVQYLPGDYTIVIKADGSEVFRTVVSISDIMAQDSFYFETASDAELKLSELQGKEITGFADKTVSFVYNQSGFTVAPTYEIYGIDGKVLMDGAALADDGVRAISFSFENMEQAGKAPYNGTYRLVMYDDSGKQILEMTHDVDQLGEYCEEVASGFSTDKNDVNTAFADAGKDIDINGIDDYTIWIIYGQNGYTQSDMTGTVTSPAGTTWGESLCADDGLRAWYFSFLNQISHLDFVNGTYKVEIKADGTTILTKDIEVTIDAKESEMNFGVFDGEYLGVDSSVMQFLSSISSTETTVSVSGEVYWLNGYEGFWGQSDTGAGYYIALTMDAPDGIDLDEVVLTTGNPNNTIESSKTSTGIDGTLVLYLGDDADFENITLTFDLDGEKPFYKSTAYTLDVSAIVDMEAVYKVVFDEGQENPTFIYVVVGQFVMLPQAAVPGTAIDGWILPGGDVQAPLTYWMVADDGDGDNVITLVAEKNGGSGTVTTSYKLNMTFSNGDVVISTTPLNGSMNASTYFAYRVIVDGKDPVYLPAGLGSLTSGSVTDTLDLNLVGGETVSVELVSPISDNIIIPYGMTWNIYGAAA